MQVHWDVAGISPNADYIILSAYDMQTWERNPYEVDYPAPIYQPHDRIPESNVDFQVNLWWVIQGAWRIIVCVDKNAVVLKSD